MNREVNNLMLAPKDWGGIAPIGAEMYGFKGRDISVLKKLITHKQQTSKNLCIEFIIINY